MFKVLTTIPGKLQVLRKYWLKSTIYIKKISASGILVKVTLLKAPTEMDSEKAGRMWQIEKTNLDVQFPLGIALTATRIAIN